MNYGVDLASLMLTPRVPTSSPLSPKTATRRGSSNPRRGARTAANYNRTFTTSANPDNLIHQNT